MAAPFSHIHYGLERFAESGWSPDELRAFVRGTVFPDIRYMGTVSRETTHKRDVTTAMVSAESEPFQRGVLAHSYVDWRQKQLVDATELPRIVGDSYAARSALKLIEDVAVYQLRRDWSELAQCFIGASLASELAYVSADTIASWDAALCAYLAESPSAESADAYLHAIGVLNTARTEMIAAFQVFSGRQDVRSLVAEIVAAWCKSPDRHV